MSQLMRFKRLSAGYTLVELLVVMAILGILAAAVMPLGEALMRAQQERQLRLALANIRQAIDEFKRAADKGHIRANASEAGYPRSLQSLVSGVTDTRQGSSGQTMYFLRQLPRDPFAAPDLPAEATWRVRSYASPPDRPALGADVFDVSSSSDGVAMDGSLLREW
jgi:general secretion pathway protein G